MYQQTILIGHIGQIKLPQPKSGTSLAQFSVVTTKSIRDSQTNEWVDKKEWHDCVSFKKCAEHIHRNFKPGDVVTLTGELSTSKFKDSQTQQDRFKTDLIVNDFPKKLPRYYTKEGSSAQSAVQPFNQPTPQSGNQYQQHSPQPDSGFIDNDIDF